VLLAAVHESAFGMLLRSQHRTIRTRLERSGQRSILALNCSGVIDPKRTPTMGIGLNIGNSVAT